MVSKDSYGSKKFLWFIPVVPKNSYGSQRIPVVPKNSYGLKKFLWFQKIPMVWKIPMV